MQANLMGVCELREVAASLGLKLTTSHLTDKLESERFNDAPVWSMKAENIRPESDLPSPGKAYLYKTTGRANWRVARDSKEDPTTAAIESVDPSELPTDEDVQW